MRDELRELGLTAEEARLYLSLLEDGGGGAGVLAKRLKRPRTSLYHTLRMLVERGLVLQSRRGSYSFFQPRDPNGLLDSMRRKADLAGRILPDLLSLYGKNSTKPRVRFYESREGVEEVFKATLRSRNEVLGYTNLELMIEIFPDLFRRYTKERIARGIKARYLSPRPAAGPELIGDFFQFDRSIEHLEILFISAVEYPFQHDIAIADDHLALLSLSRDEQISLIVESKTIAATMREIFDLAWIGASNFIAR